MEIMINKEGMSTHAEEAKSLVTKKEVANKQYLDDNEEKLAQAGYEEGGQMLGATSYLRSRLDKIRGNYLSWCDKLSNLFKDEMMERASRYRSIAEEQRAREQELERQAADIEAELTVAKQQLSLSRSRNYALQDILVLLFNLLAVAGLGFWLAYFYANVYVLWQASPEELYVNDSLVLFRLENMSKGIFFFAVPLAVAITVAIIDRAKSRWLPIMIVALFVVMDGLFSVIIETHLVEARSCTDTPYAFSWANVVIITFFGMIPSLILGKLLGCLKENVIFDTLNRKRAECQALEEKCAKLSERLLAIRQEKGQVHAEIGRVEGICMKIKEQNISSLWYSGHVLRTLYNAYYGGWLKYLSGRTDSANTTKNGDLEGESQQVLKEYLMELAA